MNFEPIDLHDLLAEKEEIPRDGQRWGKWQFQEKTFELVYKDDVEYTIDLSDCTDSAEILDWIAQLAHKIWISNLDLANLVRALDDILHFQENYCSWGENLECNPRKAWLQEN